MRDLCTFCIKARIYKGYKGFYAMECMNIRICNKNRSEYKNRPAGAVQVCYCCLNDIVLLCGFLKRAETLKLQRLQGVQQIYRYGICTVLREKG